MVMWNDLTEKQHVVIKQTVFLIHEMTISNPQDFAGSQHIYIIVVICTPDTRWTRTVHVDFFHRTSYNEHFLDALTVSVVDRTSDATETSYYLRRDTPVHSYSPNHIKIMDVDIISFYTRMFGCNKEKVHQCLLKETDFMKKAVEKKTSCLVYTIK